MSDRTFFRLETDIYIYSKYEQAEKVLWAVAFHAFLFLVLSLPLCDRATVFFMRYFVKLAYNGKRFHGWQIQPNAITVQGVLEKAFTLIMGEPIQIIGAGRTDTGVHASEFWAHFDTSRELNATDRVQLRFRLNRFLSNDVVIYGIFPVQERSHTRFDAMSRTYHYRISTIKNPFEEDFAYHLYDPLDIDRMNQAGQVLMEYRDFTSFSKLHTQVKTNICRLDEAVWEMQPNGLLVFTITADRFLRNMVRAIVGTMLDVGRGKLDLQGLREVVERKDRSEAGVSVPAKGLFLSQVKYPMHVYDPDGSFK